MLLFILKKNYPEISYHFSIDCNQSLLYFINIFFTYVFRNKSVQNTCYPFSYKNILHKSILAYLNTESQNCDNQISCVYVNYFAKVKQYLLGSFKKLCTFKCKYLINMLQFYIFYHFPCTYIYFIMYKKIFPLNLKIKLLWTLHKFLHTEVPNEIPYCHIKNLNNV